MTLTTDCWTSRATQSFVTVTAHYINDDWEIQNPVIQTCLICEAHTRTFGRSAEEVVVKWKLDRQNETIPVTTDIAKNMSMPHIQMDCLHTLDVLPTLWIWPPRRGWEETRFPVFSADSGGWSLFFHRSTTAAAILKSTQDMLQLPSHKLVKMSLQGGTPAMTRSHAI